MKKLILSLVIALFMASAAYAAGSLRDADKAHEKGDYLEVIKVLTPLAIKGVAEAQFKLAVMYENGRGVKQDFSEALKWHKLAAEQGYMLAQYNYGLMHATGRGVGRDEATAA